MGSKTVKLSSWKFLKIEYPHWLGSIHIFIDCSDCVVFHDCADWDRRLTNKELCKHIGKVLLSIPEGKALTIIRNVYSEWEKWQFKPYIS